MNQDVTVIFNGWKRPHTLKQQVHALEVQTVKPVDWMYWQNTEQGVHYDEQVSRNLIKAEANINFGVWARFSYALNARTNWVCIFDDDTIPGSQWLENCLTTVESHPGLLGTIGVIFQNDHYGIKRRCGWDNPNSVPTQVDIVGHAWFFHRDLLSVFWRELPPIDHNFIVGEDIHFSHMIQKYTDMATYVPPHPPENREMWGSLKGWELGGDKVATAGNGAIPLMEKYMKTAVDSGFRLLEA